MVLPEELLLVSAMSRCHIIALMGELDDQIGVFACKEKRSSQLDVRIGGLIEEYYAVIKV